MKSIEQLKDEIQDFERDLEEDGVGGWVLGDAYEALDNMRRQLAELERNAQPRNEK